MRRDRCRDREARGSRAFALLLGLAFLGCPGDVQDPARFSIDPVECADVERKIFAQRCGGAACHERSKPAAGLDLASPGLFDRLRWMESEECSQRRLIEPSSPQESFLVDKLDEDVGCGERMPFSRKPLTADEIDCVVGWIGRGGDPADGGARPFDAGDDDAGAEDGGAADLGASDGAAAGEGG